MQRNFPWDALYSPINNFSVARTSHGTPMGAFIPRGIFHAIYHASLPVGPSMRNFTSFSELPMGFLCRCFKNILRVLDCATHGKSPGNICAQWDALWDIPLFSRSSQKFEQWSCWKAYLWYVNPVGTSIGHAMELPRRSMKPMGNRITDLMGRPVVGPIWSRGNSHIITWQDSWDVFCHVPWRCSWDSIRTGYLYMCSCIPWDPIGYAAGGRMRHSCGYLTGSHTPWDPWDVDISCDPTYPGIHETSHKTPHLGYEKTR